MLDTSSQLMLDSAAPQTKSDSASVNKSASAANSEFSSYLDDASKNTQAREPEKQKSDENNFASEKKAHSFTRTNKKQQTQDNSDRRSVENDKAKSSSAQSVKDSRKPQEVKTAQETESAAADPGALPEPEQAALNKLSQFNPLLLLQNKSVEELTTTDVTDGEADTADAESVQAMVARILQNRANLPQTTPTAVEQETVPLLSAATQTDTPVLTSEFASALKIATPETSPNNLRNTLTKQASIKQQDSVAKVSADPLKQALAVDENDTLDDDKLDEFVARIFERMQLASSNLESIMNSKFSDQKVQFNNELIDQLTNKISGDMLDKANVLANSAVNGSQRTNSALPGQQFTMNTHINQPEWGSEFGKRIQFMMNNNVQSAELRLDPPELGRITVKINLTSDHANISFASGHQSVRDAIENTLPKLRELLAESGLQLGNTDVASQFQQKARDQERENFNLAGPIEPDLDDVDLVDNLPLAKMHYSADGVIDYFA